MLTGKEFMNRREFMLKSTQSAAITLVGLPLVIGCDEKDPCDDLSALTAEEIAERQSYNYLKESPFPTKLCINCELWLEPEEDSTCGGCGLFEGPVQRKGYCDEWVLKEV